MNGYSKGKGPIKMYETEETKQKKFGAQLKIGLTKGGYILAKTEAAGDFRLAQITEMEPIKMPEEEFQSHNDSHYKYYVSFVEFNRRWDRFVTREFIEVDVESIQKAIKVFEIKKASEEGNEEVRKIFENDEHQGMDEKTVQAHISVTKVKNISRIVFGDNMTPTWYFSPYPEPYYNLDTLYICEYCLSYFATRDDQVRHSHKCEMNYPPGDEIYRYENLSVFEVNSTKERIYTENLCLMTKLFLDHKNLHYETESFLFYVLTEYTDGSYHFVGYYSKEKESSKGYNLNCIFVLPFHQRKGYGKFLIAFSFELSLIEGKVGTPEVPLSDLGFLSYFSWWSQRLVDILLKSDREDITIADLSKETAIKQTDIIMVLERLNILRYYQGQHVLFTEKKYLEDVYKLTGRPTIPINRECLHWTPYIPPSSKPS